MENSNSVTLCRHRAHSQITNVPIEFQWVPLRRNILNNSASLTAQIHFMAGSHFPPITYDLSCDVHGLVKKKHSSTIEHPSNKRGKSQFLDPLESLGTDEINELKISALFKCSVWNRLSLILTCNLLSAITHPSIKLMLLCVNAHRTHCKQKVSRSYRGEAWSWNYVSPKVQVDVSFEPFKRRRISAHTRQIFMICADLHWLAKSYRKLQFKLSQCKRSHDWRRPRQH